MNVKCVFPEEFQKQTCYSANTTIANVDRPPIIDEVSGVCELSSILLLIITFILN